MTIQNWRVFITVCKYNSITKAAQVMHVAQPAVSRTIKEIENYYDIKLFERINKRLYITDVGEELFYRAREAVRVFDSLENYIYGGHSMKVGSSVMIGNYIIQDSIEDYHRLVPTAHIELLIDISTIVAQHVISGSLDFAIIERPTYSSEINESCFSGDHLVILCNKSHPLAKKQKISLDELITQKIFLKSKGNTSRELFDNELQKNNITITPAFESNSINAILDKVMMEEGVALMPFLQTRHRSEQENLVRLYVDDLNLRRNYYIISRKDKALSNQAKEFIEICKKKANEINRMDG